VEDLSKRLEAMLAKGQDNLLLRFSLGKAYAEREEYAAAISHLRAALDFDPGYSVAWKWLGKALQGQGDLAGAKAAWQAGVDAAHAHGNQQLVKELQVFLKRLDRGSASG